MIEMDLNEYSIENLRQFNLDHVSFENNDGDIIEAKIIRFNQKILTVSVALEKSTKNAKRSDIQFSLRYSMIFSSFPTKCSLFKGYMHRFFLICITEHERIGRA
jgi:hypothetical protein